MLIYPRSQLLLLATSVVFAQSASEAPVRYVGARMDLAARLSRQMRCSWRLRSRTSPPRPCSWRRSLWSHPWCTTSQSSTRSHPETQSKSSANVAVVQPSVWTPHLLSFVFQGVHLREDVLPAAHGHPAVSVLPEAEAGVRGEGRSHQRRDGDRQAGHRLEDQSRGEGEAPDESAAKNGLTHHMEASVYRFSCWLSPLSQTPQAPGYGDIRLSLEVIPDTVDLEEPFDIICKITNCRYDRQPCCDSTMRPQRQQRSLTLSLQWENHGPGAGDVQHRLHPLVRNIRTKAGQTQPRRLPLPAPHALLLRPGSAGTSPRVSRKGSRPVARFLFFLGRNALRLFLPECVGIKTQGHVSEEDVRVRWHRSSVRDLPVPKQRALGILLIQLAV